MNHPRCLLASRSRIPPPGGNTSGPAKPDPRCSPTWEPSETTGLQRQGRQNL
ncbi:MAG: hypothetical protein OJF60_000247 [Burkholderiaceae bacterium]|nr:MAG: hypothetical protein OJF60_000247 [Burkholderiaceae bacterium]